MESSALNLTILNLICSSNENFTNANCSIIPHKSVGLDAFLYICAVLTFYALSMVCLMAKYIRGENEDAALEYYYDEYVKRDTFSSSNRHKIFYKHFKEIRDHSGYDRPLSDVYNDTDIYVRRSISPHIVGRPNYAHPHTMFTARELPEIVDQNDDSQNSFALIHYPDNCQQKRSDERHVSMPAGGSEHNSTEPAARYRSTVLDNEPAPILARESNTKITRSNAVNNTIVKQEKQVDAVTNYRPKRKKIVQILEFVPHENYGVARPQSLPLLPYLKLSYENEIKDRANSISSSTNVAGSREVAHSV